MVLSGCGGGGSGSESQPPIEPSGSNVLAISVDRGPSALSYNNINTVFTSVTICEPGTSNCQTIDDVMVDTGSAGLRLLSAKGGGLLTLSLPVQSASDGQIYECTQFADGTYCWGPVVLADVKLAGETAGSVPIHILEHDIYTNQSDCASGGGYEIDDLQNLGANGILGIGFYQHDCGDACDPSAGGSPLAGFYYVCSAASGCRLAFVPLSQQVQNPVALFTADNNGVIIELPAVAGAAVSASGTLIFGIGTRSNNALGSATVLTLNNSAYITTKYNNQLLPYSWIDTGSNGLFFPDASIPLCTDRYIQGFYCPDAPANLSATNTGANGRKSSVTFAVENYDALFSNLSMNDDTVLSGLAGPNSFISIPESNNTNNPLLQSFDWGLPFFYGRRVFTAIEGKNTPIGEGPYWAY